MNKNSLLARIYGVFQVDMEGQDPIYLLLMGNTKKIDSNYICKMYDLKGSLVSRVVYEDPDKKKDGDAFEASFKNDACLKDVNLLNMLNKEVMLKFDKSQIPEI